MLKWDMSDQQLYDVTQYIKTFAPQVWENTDNTVGERVEPTKDPFGLARKEAAIQRGKEVYHGVAACQSCHRGYVSTSEFMKITEKTSGEAGEIEDDFYKLKLQESEYYFHDSKERFAKYLPPDFTWHELRSIRKDKDGVSSVSDIYMRLLSGVTGAGMPIWRDVIDDQDIWAVSYYVQYLTQYRDSAKRNQFVDGNK